MNELPLWIKIVILGILEGLTEFLPVSSTGHLLVAQAFLGYHWEAFTVFIQLGALLSVWWLFRDRIRKMIPIGPQASAQGRQLCMLIFLAFIPTVITGYLTRDWNRESVEVIGWATVIGGLVIMGVERWKPAPRVDDLYALTPMLVLAVGIGQCFSLCPGVSRSGATIMAGLIVGLSRPVATEFTFLLAVPTMSAATVYQLYKFRNDLSAENIWILLLGGSVAFVTALLVVRWFIHFVQTNTFIPFAWYRIAAGSLLLGLLYYGVLNVPA
jgi:undecaprenyl-diphosphatase